MEGYGHGLLRYYPLIGLAGLRKVTKNRIAGFQADT
jgi:hypothetical protein